MSTLSTMDYFCNTFVNTTYRDLIFINLNKTYTLIHIKYLNIGTVNAIKPLNVQSVFF